MANLELKAYDLCWFAKKKHRLSELERVIDKHNLEGELKVFKLKQEDFIDIAKDKLGLDISKGSKKIKKPSKSKLEEDMDFNLR